MDVDMNAASVSYGDLTVEEYLQERCSQLICGLNVHTEQLIYQLVEEFNQGKEEILQMLEIDDRDIELYAKEIREIEEEGEEEEEINEGGNDDEDEDEDVNKEEVQDGEGYKKDKNEKQKQTTRVNKGKKKSKSEEKGQGENEKKRDHKHHTMKRGRKAIDKEEEEEEKVEEGEKEIEIERGNANSRRKENGAVVIEKENGKAQGKGKGKRNNEKNSKIGNKKDEQQQSLDSNEGMGIENENVAQESHIQNDENDENDENNMNMSPLLLSYPSNRKSKSSSSSAKKLDRYRREMDEILKLPSRVLLIVLEGPHKGNQYDLKRKTPLSKASEGDRGSEAIVRSSRRLQATTSKGEREKQNGEEGDDGKENTTTVFLIGRNKSKAYRNGGVSLHADFEVSTEHGKIELDGKGVATYTDRDSTNGSFYNDKEVRRLVPIILQTGSKLTLGKTVMEVTIM